MAKLTNPLFSFLARGTLAKALTFRRRGGQAIAGKPPHPQDANSPAQKAWRPMYKACTVLWHLLSPLEKQAWESQGTARHMTGFAYYMSQCLRPNPGIYLPLAGGTMKGAIDMDSNSITGLPVPTLAPDAATKAYVDGAAVPPDYPMILKPNLVRYVLPGWYSGGMAKQLVQSDRIYYIPIFVTETTTYTAIGIRVGTGSVGTADLRIYAWENGLPGALILNCGTVSTSPASFKETAITQQLTRGYYFLAIRCTATPSLYAPSADYAIAPPVPGMYTSPNPLDPRVIPSADGSCTDPARAPTVMNNASFASVYLREN